MGWKSWWSGRNQHFSKISDGSRFLGRDTMSVILLIGYNECWLTLTKLWKWPWRWQEKGWRWVLPLLQDGRPYRLEHMLSVMQIAGDVNCKKHWTRWQVSRGEIEHRGMKVSGNRQQSWWTVIFQRFEVCSISRVTESFLLLF